MYILYTYSLKCTMLKLCIPISHKHQPLGPKHHQTLRHVPHESTENGAGKMGKSPVTLGIS